MIHVNMKSRLDYGLGRSRTYLASNDHIFQRCPPAVQRGCGVVAETFLYHLSCKARIALELLELRWML